MANVVRSESRRPAILARAEGMVKRIKGLNELNDAAISKFAEAKKFEEVAASLAILNNSASIEMMVRVLE